MSNGQCFSSPLHRAPQICLPNSMKMRRDEGGPAPFIISNAQSHRMVDFPEYKLYHVAIKKETSLKATNFDPGFMSTSFSRQSGARAQYYSLSENFFVDARSPC